MVSKWCTDGIAMDNFARILMAEMAKDMSVTGESVGIRVGQFEFLSDALFGLIKHDYSFDDDTLFKFFTTALKTYYKKDQKLSNATNFLREFDKECGNALSKQQEFSFISALGVKELVPLSRVIDGCSIRFHRELPKKYRVSRARLLSIHNLINVHLENEDYIFVEIRTSSFNAHTAFSMAREALAVYRALWELHLGKKISLFTGPGLHKFPAEASLKIGNLHTVHCPDGSAATEAHWYEDTPQSNPPIYIRDPNPAEASIGKMLKKLARASKEYQVFCRKALLAYMDALDTSDREAKFVKLWLCLELLTGADDAKSIIRRVAFFYTDQEIVTAQLRALRAARNSHVHAGTKPLRLDVKSFKLCEYVEQLLSFVIYNHFKFVTSSQWHDFMSTTTDVKSIDEQIRRLKMVKRFAAPRQVPE